MLSLPQPDSEFRELGLRFEFRLYGAEVCVWGFCGLGYTLNHTMDPQKGVGIYTCINWLGALRN